MTELVQVIDSICSGELPQPLDTITPIVQVNYNISLPSSGNLPQLF